MLVLCRKLGQKIFCRMPSGENLNITVVDIERGKIRLGIEAPRSVVIAREEIQEMLSVRPVEHLDVND